ncbi:MAG: FKBP-type peptidyl-prolyl cis-trans isomerase [Eggerthellaceae bacterium]|nr:FKBP-type peptidyl-prolyl cis-trans isomerase [Eggerthellaceae bacterium]
MAEIGEIVLVNCVGKLDDGTVFQDSRLAGEPLSVKIGAGSLLPRVEAALCDMLPGERRSIRLTPDQAFGVYDAGLVQSVQADLIADSEHLPRGGFIELRTKIGMLRAKVISVDADQAVLDFNHELAGCTVTFDIDLVSVTHESAIQRELHPAGCACGCDKLKAQLMRDKVFGRVGRK